MKFDIVFKRGLEVVARVHGLKQTDPDLLTVGELESVVTTVEPLLEKLTGLRVHVEQVS